MSGYEIAILSLNKDFRESLKHFIKGLNKKTGEGLKASEDAEGKDNILFLDNSCLGNIFAVAQSLKAPLIEYVFFDFNSGQEMILISDLYQIEYTEGEVNFKLYEDSASLLAKRCGDLSKGKSLFYVKEDAFSLNKINVKRKGMIKEATKGIYMEGSYEELLKENSYDVIITDGFSRNLMLKTLEKEMGIKPSAIHIVSQKADIYMPYSSTSAVIFKGDAESSREALLAFYLSLRDRGKVKSAKRLFEAMLKIPLGGDYLRLVMNESTRDLRRKNN